LTGCAGTAALAPVSSTSSDTRTAAPSAPASPVPRTAEPTIEPDPIPESFVTKYEFLGEGSANIVYVRDGSQVIQEVVTLPYEMVLNDGPNPTIGNPYLSGSASYTQDGDLVGCRLTRNNVVIDEVLPTTGSISAQCNSL
jgi:hypothetical protein